MSDQSPSLNNLGSVDGRNLINVPGGGGGITSINGDVTPAQTFNGLGCTVIDNGGGSHTISVPAPLTGVTSINADNAAAQVLAAGAGISIVDGGGGLHTISCTIPAGVTSINGDATPAQTIAVGAGLSIVDGGGGLHTINVSFPARLTSINGDTTAAQILVAGAGITITPGPAGTNTIASTGGVPPVQPKIRRSHAGNLAPVAGLVTFDVTDFSDGPAFTLGATSITIPNTADFAANQSYFFSCNFCQNDAGGGGGITIEIRVNGLAVYTQLYNDTSDGLSTVNIALLVRLSPLDVLTVATNGLLIVSKATASLTRIY